MVQLRDDVVGLDAAILSPPAIWEASGHLANFTDPLVDCRNCKERFRLDKLEDPTRARAAAPGHLHRGPRSSTSCSRPTPARSRAPGPIAYLRPETAQGMFVNFQNVLNTAARSRRSASPRSASRSATRSRRATSCSARASSSRWRWSTSSRPTRRPSGTSTGARSGPAGTSISASRRTGCACAPTTPTSCRHYSSRHLRRGVPVPVGLGRARGRRQPRRLRSHPARRRTPARSSTTSTRRPTRATCRT